MQPFFKEFVYLIVAFCIHVCFLEKKDSNFFFSHDLVYMVPFILYMVLVTVSISPHI